MPGDEIEVPKELREFMLEGAEETFLGQKNGADKQYRYGNLHIREYPDKFLVHNDKVDPRKDPSLLASIPTGPGLRSFLHLAAIVTWLLLHFFRTRGRPQHLVGIEPAAE